MRHLQAVVGVTAVALIGITGVLALPLLAACGGDAAPIGGGWYSGRRTSLSMDDRGAKGMLYRKLGGKRIDVGTDVYDYRFYPPDCVVWQTGSSLFGACGDRRPFPVAISHSLDATRTSATTPE